MGKKREIIKKVRAQGKVANDVWFVFTTECDDTIVE